MIPTIPVAVVAMILAGGLAWFVMLSDSSQPRPASHPRAIEGSVGPPAVSPLRTDLQETIAENDPPKRIPVPVPTVPVALHPDEEIKDIRDLTAMLARTGKYDNDIGTSMDLMIHNIKEATGLSYWESRKGWIVQPQPGYLRVHADHKMQEHVDRLLEDIREWVVR